MRIDLEFSLKPVYKRQSISFSMSDSIAHWYDDVNFYYEGRTFLVTRKFMPRARIIGVSTFERSIESYLAGFNSEGFNVEVEEDAVIELESRITCTAYELEHYLALKVLM